MTTDVTDCGQVKRLVDAAVRTVGRVAVMINNAGLMPQALLELLKVDEWDQMINVNIKGVLSGRGATAYEGVKIRHFINVSSVAGHRVGPGFAVYAASKHAVLALSEGLRQEAKPHNIRTAQLPPNCQTP